MQGMHTRLPDFFTKVEAAATRRRPDTLISVKGLESIDTAKIASLRVGRIEDEIYELTQDEEITEVKVVLVPTNPEIEFTVMSKGYTADGRCKTAIVEGLAVSIPTDDYYLIDAETVIDRRYAGNTDNKVFG